MKCFHMITVFVTPYQVDKKRHVKFLKNILQKHS